MTSNVKATRIRFAGIVLAFALFAGLRFTQLTARPMHNDEGVNGFFMTQVLKGNTYKYDPSNYHGPTLYYFQWLPSKIFGLTVSSVRGTIAVASLFLLAGFLFCTPLIGFAGVCVASLFAGLSADMVYFSRYFIHEIYVLLFTFGIFLAGWRFFATRRPLYAYLTALSAVLLFSTKETGVLHMAILAIAAISAPLISREPLLSPAVDALKSLRRHWVGLLALVAAVWFLMFSSFFKHMPGLLDSFRAYIPWVKQGVESGHEKPWFYYLSTILLRFEPGLTVFAAFGAIVAFIRNEARGWFLALWAFGTIALYSAIPYKTPWLAVNFVLPMALLAGYGAQCAIDWLSTLEPAGLRRRLRTLGIFLFAVALMLPLGTMWRMNYMESTDERYPQAYVHTSPDIFRLIEDINDVATKTGKGKGVSIHIVSDQYWPLPFYFQDFPSAKFWGTLNISGELDAPLLVASMPQRGEVKKKLKESYSIRTYTLRPGCYLDLWINNGAIDRMFPPKKASPLLRSVSISRGLKPGLTEEIYMDASGAGAVTTTRVITQPSFFYVAEDKKPANAPYSIRWTGFLKTPTAGVYTLSLDSDDGSQLTMDGAVIIDNAGAHPLTRKSAEIELSEGYHALEIFYTEIGGTAAFDFYWKRPGSRAEEIVPAGALFTSR